MDDLNTDYNVGYYEGKDFARRSSPRLPNPREYMDIAECFSDQFDYDFDEAFAIIQRAYISVFGAYRSESGFVCKVACVQYETGDQYFDHYKWAGGSCSLIVRKV